MANKTTAEGKIYGYMDKHLEPALINLLQIIDKTLGQDYYELTIQKDNYELTKANNLLMIKPLKFTSTGRHDFRHTLDDFIELTINRAKTDQNLTSLYKKFEENMKKDGEIYLVFDYEDEQPSEMQVVKGQYHIIIKPDLTTSKVIAFEPQIIDLAYDKNGQIYICAKKTSHSGIKIKRTTRKPISGSIPPPKNRGSKNRL